MTAEQKQAEEIYHYMGRSCNNAECAIALLYHHNVNAREYWSEVWYELLLKYGERWQASHWDDDISKEHYIEHVCPR